MSGRSFEGTLLSGLDGSGRSGRDWGLLVEIMEHFHTLQKYG